MSITNTDVIPNAYLDDLGTDWVGVNAGGVIIARAGSQEDVMKCGDPGEIAAAFNAEHLAHLLPGTPAPIPADPDGNPPNDAAPPETADTPPSDVEPPAAPKPAKKTSTKKK